MCDLLGDEWALGLSGLRSDVAAAKSVVVVQAAAWEKDVLMLGRLRLFVDLLEDLLDVASLTAVVGITKKDTSEKRVLLASFGALHLVAGEVGA